MGAGVSADEGRHEKKKKKGVSFPEFFVPEELIYRKLNDTFEEKKEQGENTETKDKGDTRTELSGDIFSGAKEVDSDVKEAASKEKTAVYSPFDGLWTSEDMGLILIVSDLKVQSSPNEIPVKIIPLFDDPLPTQRDAFSQGVFEQTEFFKEWYMEKQKRIGKERVFDPSTMWDDPKLRLEKEQQQRLNKERPHRYVRQMHRERAWEKEGRGLVYYRAQWDVGTDELKVFISNAKESSFQTWCREDVNLTPESMLPDPSEMTVSEIEGEIASRPFKTTVSEIEGEIASRNIFSCGEKNHEKSELIERLVRDRQNSSGPKRLVRYIEYTSENVKFGHASMYPTNSRLTKIDEAKESKILDALRKEKKKKFGLMSLLHQDLYIMLEPTIKVERARLPALLTWKIQEKIDDKSYGIKYTSTKYISLPPRVTVGRLKRQMAASGKFNCKWSATKKGNDASIRTYSYCYAFYNKLRWAGRALDDPDEEIEFIHTQNGLLGLQLFVEHFIPRDWETPFNEAVADKNEGFESIIRESWPY